MKILASDYDGTLYFGKEVGIKQEDKDAIKAFQEAGNLFGICSGRPFTGMKERLGGIEPDFYIQNSGAEILDKDGNHLFQKYIPQEIVRIIAERNPGFPATFFGEGLYMNMETGIPIIRPLKELKEKNYEGIYAISVTFKEDNMAHEFLDEVKRLPNIDVFQNRRSLDCCPQGCSKETGVAFMKEYFKADDIACIGDSYNDIPMLELSNSGFTFNNSPEEVKEKAAYVVDSVAEATRILMQ